LTVHPLPPDYVVTRTALHSVAEHVLAPALHAYTGRIGLRVVPGGFATPRFDGPAGTRGLMVVDRGLVLRTDDGDRRAPLTTVGELAAFVGIDGGAPSEVYQPLTPFEPDAPLLVDDRSFDALVEWFALVDAALQALRGELDVRSPSPAQLWPEHFDEAFDAGEVNYGGSPGDASHDEPYLYVGPWSPPSGEFWNESFGASRPRSALDSVADALEFLREGASRA
jgi:hypothetical protein